ncbi:MAG: tRNA 2-thiouridine(34) synthase MnmA [Candidatus Pacebacteria bacterium]|nr:tRNA 2-thiouridine(34) synthase MnmA [Candidatus Paceibacterota bacterium]
MALLKDQGHDVVGVFIKTWQPDWLACTWKEERRDAMRVCAHLDVPFVELDLEDAYKQGVADYMIAEYKKGRTPNPDVMCNREVKFGGFLSWARAQGAHAVATGHYAQSVYRDGAFHLLMGKDASKDQSYFLWTLTQDQLAHILFPVGHLEKKEVRRLAEKYALPTATKKDSQGICFIGQVSMKDFLSHYIEHTPGNVLNEAGEVIGTHTGALFYTVGERHGFTVTHKGTHDAPYYVIAKDIANNTITVSHAQALSENISTHIVLSDVIMRTPVHNGDTYQGVIRYHGDMRTYTVHAYDPDTHRLVLVSDVLDRTRALGQSLVLYRDDVCVGGGIIEE